MTTNIIGHGVDVDRFNVIVFAGFTRLVAEYIQASARVGRRFPGISIFVPTPQSERDRSIFDRFAKFHQYLDRLVDPAAVTRWPEPAMRRTLPGLLCGYLMGVASSAIGQAHWRPSKRYDIPTVIQGPEPWRRMQSWNGCCGLRLRARTLSPNMQRSLSSGSQEPFQLHRQHAETTRSPHQLNFHLDSMNSLRDVDEPADHTYRKFRGSQGAEEVDRCLIARTYAPQHNDTKPKPSSTFVRCSAASPSSFQLPALQDGRLGGRPGHHPARRM